MDSSKNEHVIPLGREVQYSNSYDPRLLFKIARPDRCDLFLKFGFDRWICYEFTWINHLSCPQSCLLEIVIPAASKFIVESKSLKLYLGSFTQETFKDKEAVIEVIKKDLSLLLESEEVSLKTLEISSSESLQIRPAPGISIDSETVTCSEFTSASKDLLDMNPLSIHEILHSNVFRSLCPVTGQPDFATIVIEYFGTQINHKSLLRYLVSFRNHAGFHETCCEKIFEDIISICKPEKLTVGCFFNRRGGIDINPIRATEVIDKSWARARFARQ